jgi:hypothetical protein
MAIVDDFKEINKRVRAISPHALGNMRKTCEKCSDYGWIVEPTKRVSYIVCPACYNPQAKQNPMKKV